MIIVQRPLRLPLIPPALTLRRYCSVRLLRGAALALTLLLCFGLKAVAEGLPAATSRPLLTVTGAIAATNAGNAAALDRELLTALPQRTITTRTPWTNGPVTFKGPLLRELIERLGGRGDTILATALNDYRIAIPMEDARRFAVIVAMERDGRAMSIRQRGPLWIIYPWDDHPELRKDTYYARSIWQLHRLHIE